jgi:DNA-directed RNA polymerase specialized sigma24 family protein
MDNKKLNNLVIAYQVSKDEATFNEIYNEVITKNVRSFGTIGKSIRADEHETLALYEDTLLRCIGKYDGTADFQNYFNRCVVRSRTDLFRKTSRRHDNEDIYGALDNDDESLEIASDYDLENHVLQTKEADQRQLIDFLTTNSDETTKAIVEAYRTQPRSSALAIAKGLGLHHMKVSRKLEKLASTFDEKQFGSHRDYLVAL